MGRVTFPRVAARLITVAAALLSTLAVPGPSAAAATCPDVDVVFGRGTGEPPGVGRVGQAFIDALQSQIPSRTVASYAVDYPASYDFLAAQDGAIDAARHVRAMAQQCPNTRIVLGGYSQGAAVVDMLMGIPPVGDKLNALSNKFGSVGMAAPLSTDLAANVAAVAVFGNPATKFSNPATSAPSPYGARAIDLCKNGDPICSHGHNPFAHDGYETSDFIPQAAGFVAGLV